MKKHDQPVRTRQEIVRILRSELERNAWPPNTQMEPIRDLAKRYGVSYVTMRRALLELRDEGLLEMRHGAGVFVAGPQPDRPPRRAQRRVGIILPPHFGEREPEVASGILASFIPRMERHGWETVPISTADNRCAEPAFADEVQGRDLDAVVWLSPHMTHQMNLMRLSDRGMPVVGFGRRFPGMPIPTVTLDLDDLARQVVAHCADEGHDRLGFIAPALEGPDADPAAVDRLRALREHAASHHPAVAVDPVVRWAPDLLVTGGPLKSPIDSHRDVRVWVLAFQRYLTPLASLAADGFWPDPEAVTVIDSMGHDTEPVPGDLAGLRCIRVVQPAEAHGVALARELEKLWLGAPEGPHPGLGPRLVEVPRVPGASML